MFHLQFAHSAPITFLRGLQARCCWAATLGGADADLGEALDLALAQGHHDLDAVAPPTTFRHCLLMSRNSRLRGATAGSVCEIERP